MLDDICATVYRLWRPVLRAILCCGGGRAPGRGRQGHELVHDELPQPLTGARRQMVAVAAQQAFFQRIYCQDDLTGRSSEPVADAARLSLKRAQFLQETTNASSTNS
jgi:hypothetical protein